VQANPPLPVRAKLPVMSDLNMSVIVEFIPPAIIMKANCPAVMEAIAIVNLAAIMKTNPLAILKAIPSVTVKVKNLPAKVKTNRTAIVNASPSAIVKANP
jgi:hypothetical protein